MKKLLFVLSIVFLFSSCDSDDDGDNTPNSLSGNFEIVSYTSAIAFDYNLDGTETTNVLLETGCIQDDDIDFNSETTATFFRNSNWATSITEDPNNPGNFFFTQTCTASQGFGTFDVTLAYQGNTVVATFNDFPASWNGTISEDFTTVTFIAPENFPIFEFDADGYIVLDANNQPVFSLADATLEFTKV